MPAGVRRRAQRRASSGAAGAPDSTASCCEPEGMVTRANTLPGEDDGALERLYRRYSVWLGRRLRARLDADAAADVVQETYLRIAPHAGGDIRHPKAFLLRIAMNLVRDDARAQARRFRHLHEEASPRADPAVQVDQVLLAEIIRAMPELYRDVFVLSRFEGMTYPDIARTLDVSVPTVKWRMARAVEYCASRLDL